MKQAYRKFKEVDIKCLPVKDKLPVSGQGWKQGIDDESLYTDGIAIVCGEVSGGIECIDFDNHFDDAQKTLSRFAKDVDVIEVLKKYDIIY